MGCSKEKRDRGGGRGAARLAHICPIHYIRFVFQCLFNGIQCLIKVLWQVVSILRYLIATFQCFREAFFRLQEIFAFQHLDNICIGNHSKLTLQSYFFYHFKNDDIL